MGPVACGTGRQEERMAVSRLPGDGELTLGPVRLPDGKQVRAGYGSGEPVAWITLDKVPDAGRVWAALSRAHPETGLVPFLASGLRHDSAERPWDQEEFTDPADVAGLDGMVAAVLLEEMWDDSTHEVADEARRRIRSSPSTSRGRSRRSPASSPAWPPGWRRA
jgi:hypothetical protein